MFERIKDNQDYDRFNDVSCKLWQEIEHEIRMGRTTDEKSHSPARSQTDPATTLVSQII